jgi:ribonuclease VapC
MIAVDTSALMAILLQEDDAASCIETLQTEPEILMSAATLAEALIVAARRNIGEEMAALINSLGIQIINVTPAAARRVADAYAQWGKGVHKAGLNFGDCFAYEIAKQNACRLLFTGNDFFKNRHRNTSLENS